MRKCLAGKNTLNLGDGNTVQLKRKSALKCIFINSIGTVVAALDTKHLLYFKKYLRECIDEGA